MEPAARLDSAVAPENEEATEAWSGVLFDVYVEYRDLIVGGPLQHAEVAMRAHPPRPGDRVLDVGCGFGDTTRQLAALVGEKGSALGLDVAEPFIEAATTEARKSGNGNVAFQSGDAQVMRLPGPFDYVYSQIGMMFFANPVQAMRNLLSAMSPGGRLCAVVWRRKLDNDWLHRAEQVVDKYLDEPEETDVATCGPGPFSMANADTVSEQLGIAGFEEISFQRCDMPIKIGDDLEHAIRFNMAIGPAAELIRLNPETADELRPVLAEELREALTEFQGPDGVWAPASTWIIGARAPAAS